MRSAHRIKKPSREKRGANVSLDIAPNMSADLSKKKKGYTTVLLRLSTGTQAKARRASHRPASRVRFLPERATLERLTASLQALPTNCGY
jgi:hypothetical protein